MSFNRSKRLTRLAETLNFIEEESGEEVRWMMMIAIHKKHDAAKAEEDGE